MAIVGSPLAFGAGGAGAAPCFSADGTPCASVGQQLEQLVKQAFSISKETQTEINTAMTWAQAKLDYVLQMQKYATMLAALKDVPAWRIALMLTDQHKQWTAMENQWSAMRARAESMSTYAGRMDDIAKEFGKNSSSRRKYAGFDDAILGMKAEIKKLEAERIAEASKAEDERLKAITKNTSDYKATQAETNKAIKDAIDAGNTAGATNAQNTKVVASIDNAAASINVVVQSLDAQAKERRQAEIAEIERKGLEAAAMLDLRKRIEEQSKGPPVAIDLTKDDFGSKRATSQSQRMK